MKMPSIYLKNLWDHFRNQQQENPNQRLKEKQIEINLKSQYKKCINYSQLFKIKCLRWGFVVPLYMCNLFEMNNK